MNCNNELQLVDDIVLFKDPGVFKKKYYLISNGRNVCLKLDEAKYTFFSKIIPYFNGNYSRDKIEKMTEVDFGEVFPISQLIDFFKKHKLFKEQEAEYKSKIEFEMSGKKIKEINLEKMCIKGKKFFDIIYRCTIIFSIITIITALFLLFSRFDVVFAIQNETKAFNWSSVKIYEYIFIIIGVIITLIFHEMGHIVSAIRSGVTVKSISFYMLFGIAPVFFVKYKNINLSPSLTRIKIMLSGIYINLFLVCFFFILLNFTSYWIFAVIMLINIGCIFSALSLMGTTDGYFALTTIFNIEGLRWNALKTISAILNKRESLLCVFKDFKTFIFAGYIVICYLTSFFMLNYYIKLVTKYIGLSNLLFVILNRTIIVLLVIIFVNSMIKFFKSVKSI